MKKDKEVMKAKETLQQINLYRPMSQFHPRFQIFREALDELIQEGEIGRSEAVYFAFCFAEQKAKEGVS